MFVAITVQKTSRDVSESTITYLSKYIKSIILTHQYLMVCNLEEVFDSLFAFISKINIIISNNVIKANNKNISYSNCFKVESLIYFSPNLTFKKNLILVIKCELPN